MRLIDGDALRDKSFMTGEHPTVNNPYRDLDEVVSVDDIDNAPTIKATLIKHGYWIDNPYPNYPAHDIRYCSECGWNIHKSKLRNSDLNWSYCPNCGAKICHKLNKEV